MSGELFRGVKQFEFQSPASAAQLGRESFRIPVYYYDNSSLTVIHTASTARVRPYLPDPRMHPLEVAPGRCLVAFTAFEYRKTDIDPYNEFSIAILINFDKTVIPGLSVLRQLLSNAFHAYVWHLPVTTEIARYGGVELYGYPRRVAGGVAGHPPHLMEETPPHPRPGLTPSAGGTGRAALAPGDTGRRSSPLRYSK